MDELPSELLAELSPQKAKYDGMSVSDMRASGMTYSEIGRVFGVSKQRVHQMHKREASDG